MNAWKVAHFSMVFLWLDTALTSVSGGRQLGYEVLSGAGITGVFADICVFGGAGLDLFLGIWLVSSITPLTCLRVQAIIVLLYSLLLSCVAPGFWLHPFGPLTKNIPILAIIFLLMQHYKATQASDKGAAK
jgi:hypothetical protein